MKTSFFDAALVRWSVTFRMTVKNSKGTFPLVRREIHRTRSFFRDEPVASTIKNLLSYVFLNVTSSEKGLIDSCEVFVTMAYSWNGFSIAKTKSFQPAPTEATRRFFTREYLASHETLQIGDLVVKLPRTEAGFVTKLLPSGGAEVAFKKFDPRVESHPFVFENVFNRKDLRWVSHNFGPKAVREGDLLFHNVFGAGEVLSVEEDHAVVKIFFDFLTGEETKLSLLLSNLNHTWFLI